MPKRADLHTILVIGSGPIVIGQAAEFDYAGTQACLALREEGYRVILCNSNPATIMTDPSVADKVYMEPLTLDYLARIIRVERPDALLPGIGGQTGLNLAMELQRAGVLDECGVELLGTRGQSINRAEDRELFKELCQSIGEPVLNSEVATSVAEAEAIAARIGYPVVLRPAFTLGGTGGGFADGPEQLAVLMENGLALSPVGQVLVEKSVRGYKEIEYEVMRDANDTAIIVCNMENIDPVGIHTGDSLVVAPSQTLTNREYQMLRDSALKIVRELQIEGGCNVQFALDPHSQQYFLIEVNPRVSRSSALASKASGYPIARVSAKIAVGLHLDEIFLANTLASFEPALDYVVTKVPRFPFDKFDTADRKLGTQMKATGEAMAVGRTMEESLLKAIRSLESGVTHLHLAAFDDATDEALWNHAVTGTDQRPFALAELLRRGATVEDLAARTGMDPLFLRVWRNIVTMEGRLTALTADGPLPTDQPAVFALNGEAVALLRQAKRMGFADAFIGRLWGCRERDVFKCRRAAGILPTYKMIDTCASEFASYVPYFYSTYETENESVVSARRKVIVVGSGPIRIGQGVEFDYSTVHAVQTIRAMGYEAIVVNNNPETVSTDYTTADKLYFEPLTTEDVMNIVALENPEGVIVTLGGQTAVNLAQSLADRDVPIIGTDCAAIRRAEDRDEFEALLQELHIPQPTGHAVMSVAEGVAAAQKIGFPVLVRPSFVLGGRAMRIVAKIADLEGYLQAAFDIDADKPVLVDHYIRGKEVEVDAICDGTHVFVPGIMELVERTGVHSGDSISVYPSFSLSDAVKETILDYAERLGLGIGIRGLFNIQFIVDEHDDVFIIEVNPRSSRTVPFLSKATGYPLADIATKVMLGLSLADQGITMRYPAERKKWYVKVPVFSFSKLQGMDYYLSPEMKSTGEAIGYDTTLPHALYKAFQASGMKMKPYGTVLITVADEDKKETLPLAQRFRALGYRIEATSMTADYLRVHGVDVAKLPNLSEGDTASLDAIMSGRISYIINTRAIMSGVHYINGAAMRNCAVAHGVTMFTSLDTVRALLEVLEEILPGVSTIDEEDRTEQGSAPVFARRGRFLR